MAIVASALAEQGIESNDLEVVMELGNEEAIEMAVERGIGIAFVSELAAARCRALVRIRQVDISGLDLSRTIYKVRNVCCPMTRAHDRFWSFVEDQREKLGSQIWREVDHLALEFLSSEYSCRTEDEIQEVKVLEDL